jgi:predicted RNase H-like HicB family nuclease
MLTQYIEKAMRHAHYEMMENGRFFGSITPCKGCWGEGATLEECRVDLQSALEDWITLGLRHGDPFEIIEGIDLNDHAQPHAKAHQTT